MKLPINPHITECFSTREIAEKMNSGDYSAELLLQHLASQYNRVKKENDILREALTKIGAYSVGWKEDVARRALETF